MNALEAREVIRNAMNAGQLSDNQLVAYQQKMFNKWYIPGTRVGHTLNLVDISLAESIVTKRCKK